MQCALLQKWKKKCDDDSETYNWIHANTKECPKCQATIEKDGGCNHIVCRNSVHFNSSRTVSFNFLVLSVRILLGLFGFVEGARQLILQLQQVDNMTRYWNMIAYRNMTPFSRYNEDESQDARQSQETSRANLQRYLFYYNRYYLTHPKFCCSNQIIISFHNHYQSLKFEHRIRKKVKVKMDVSNLKWLIHCTYFTNRICWTEQMLTCRGLRSSSWRWRRISFAKVASVSCSPTSLLFISKRQTLPLYSKTIRWRKN